jgi:hypothetical protein
MENIINIAYDIIDNSKVDTKNLSDFLRMAEDYQCHLLMQELNKESNQD